MGKNERGKEDESEAYFVKYMNGEGCREYWDGGCGSGEEEEVCLRMIHRSVDTRYNLLAYSSMVHRLVNYERSSSVPHVHERGLG